MALLRALLVLALIATPAAAQAPAPPPDPIVRSGATEKIAAHAYVIRDQSVPLVANIGFVVGSKGTLVIDTGLGEPNGKVVLAEARKLAPANKLYIVTTHVHPEHDLGAQAFPADAVMIRSKAQVQEIADSGLGLAQTFARRSPAIAKMLEGAAYRKGDLIFETTHELDLGGVKARIVAVGPNHTPGDTVTLVEGEGVLYSGDVAMKGAPAFASPRSSLAHWLGALDQLDAMKPKIVVPSHGVVGDAGLISGYRAYLTEIRTRTSAEKKAGKTVEQTVEAVTAAMKDRYPDAGRLAGAVRNAYQEAG